MINFDSEGLVDNVLIATLPAPRSHYSATTCWSGHSGEMPEFPLTRWAGDFWMRPTMRKKTKNNDCDQCMLVDLCQEQVTAGGYCGCEKVLVGELMV